MKNLPLFLICILLFTELCESSEIDDSLTKNVKDWLEETRPGMFMSFVEEYPPIMSIARLHRDDTTILNSAYILELAISSQSEFGIKDTIDVILSFHHEWKLNGLGLYRRTAEHVTLSYYTLCHDIFMLMADCRQAEYASLNPNPESLTELIEYISKDREDFERVLQILADHAVYIRYYGYFWVVICKYCQYFRELMIWIIKMAIYNIDYDAFHILLRGIHPLKLRRQLAALLICQSSDKFDSHWVNLIVQENLFTPIEIKYIRESLRSDPETQV